MQYRYATERENYADLSSGRVFYNQPGHPALPVRLASEIFQRGLAYLRAEGFTSPCLIYDPCCGGAYHLGVLGFLHWTEIHEIAASDIDPETVCFARKNLGLLRSAGMQQRIDELQSLLARYGKVSHRDALESARRMQAQIQMMAPQNELKTAVFQANAADGAGMTAGLQGRRADLVISDVPYGQHSHWNNLAGESGATPLFQMLEALRCALRPGGLAAIICDKSQKAMHPAYQRLEQFPAGKRRVAVLRLTA
ncbi:MAG TPA: hypothetical protein PKW33_05520 [Anaerolineaceae bacterium]|nr:hypothetical protein [Anaerolineaceae bacterium]HPN51025.1 hypothetical protein [Anaerolineaceae bacterium]